MVDRQYGYTDTQGIRFLREMASLGKFVFSVDEAKGVAARIDMAAGYVRQVLSQLVKTGWVERLRRGLYAWSGTLPGAAPVHSFVVATQLVQPSAISHWSALSHHGFTEQVPQLVMASTPRKVVTPSMRASAQSRPEGRHLWEVGGVRYEYITVRPDYFFGIGDVWIDQMSRVPVTDPERTLLDLFAQPRLFGGLGEALAVVQEHVGDVDVRRLVSYALRYGRGAVTKRLGWALERVGVEGSLLVPLLEAPTTGYKILDPTKPHRGPCDSRWRVQNNLEQGGHA
jgi:predicted transcriptional regulator of viral defense system